MADYRIDSEILTGIADAIRGKTNKVDAITPENMASEISSITTGGGENKLAQVVDKSITELTAEDLAGVKNIGHYSFSYCKNLSIAQMSDEVESIGYSAFNSCNLLSSMTMSKSLKSICAYAFAGCWELSGYIKFPDGVTNIGSNTIVGGNIYNGWTFSTCKKITGIDVGNGVSEIPPYCFYNCSGMLSAILGSGVAQIKTSAFFGCTALKSITVFSETPPIIQSDTFQGVPKDCAFYVPAASVDAYKAATNWSARADYIFPISGSGEKGEVYTTLTYTGDEYGAYFGDTVPPLVAGDKYFIEDTPFTARYVPEGTCVSPPDTNFIGADGKAYCVIRNPYDWLIAPPNLGEYTQGLTITIYKEKE